MVPTLTFLAVFWVKGGQTDSKKLKGIVVPGEDESLNDENGENVDEKGEPNRYRFLVHMARMTPMLEGAVEAPIQFIFQVLFSFKKLKANQAKYTPAHLFLNH